MNHPINQILIEAEGRHLKTAEIEQLKEYTASWASRNAAYRTIREKESLLLEQTLMQLKQEIPNLSPRLTELCKQDMALVLRHCAMAMLLMDEDLLQERLIEWMEDRVQIYSLQTTYQVAFQLLQEALRQHLETSTVERIRPFITQAQVSLIV